MMPKIEPELLRNEEMKRAEDFGKFLDGLWAIPSGWATHERSRVSPSPPSVGIPIAGNGE